MQEEGYNTGLIGTVPSDCCLATAVWACVHRLWDVYILSGHLYKMA